MAPTETKCVISVIKTFFPKRFVDRKEERKKKKRMLERRRRALKKSEPPILVALRVKKNKKTCLSVMCDNMSSCMHGIKGWVFFFILKHLLQRLPFTHDNSQASLCLPVSFSSVYTFIHLPVTACVRQSMKKLLRLGLVSQC